MKRGETPAQQARAWLLKLTSGSATQADADVFRRWLAAEPDHEAAFREQKRLWRDMGPALQANAASLSHKPRPRLTGRRAFLGGMVAASAAYLAVRPPLGMWPSIEELGDDYRTAAGEQRHVELGQGRALEMNTRTRIQVRDGTPGLPVIELADGEAELRVQNGPIGVLVGSSRVDARDALFNLRYIDGEGQLCCLAGNVRLTHGGTVQDLAPGRAVRFDDRTVQPATQVDPQAVAAWRDGWLVFDQQPLADVVRELNRYRRAPLILVNTQLGQRLVRARIAVAQVAEVDELIREAYGAKVTRLPAGVVLLT